MENNNGVSQREIVLRELKDKGEVTRNWCLSNHISRLGAIICNLKKEGYEIEAIRGIRRSDDYKYILIK